MSTSESNALKEFLRNTPIRQKDTSTDVTQDDAQMAAHSRSELSRFLATTKAVAAPNADAIKEAGLDPQMKAQSRAELSKFLGSQLGLTAPRAVAPTAAPIPPPAAAVAPAAAKTATATLERPPVAAPLPAAIPDPLPVPTPQKTNNGKAIAWAKHVNAVESAIRIADFHFAESILAILMEAAEMVGDRPTKARLVSLMARIKIEHRQVPQAQDMLTVMLKELSNTPDAQTMGAAYCMHALAQCYHMQGNTQQAEKAQGMAIFTAERAVGPCEPEVDAFRKKLG